MFLIHKRNNHSNILDPNTYDALRSLTAASVDFLVADRRLDQYAALALSQLIQYSDPATYLGFRNGAAILRTDTFNLELIGCAHFPFRKLPYGSEIFVSAVRCDSTSLFEVRVDAKSLKSPEWVLLDVLHGHPLP